MHLLIHGRALCKSMFAGDDSRQPKFFVGHQFLFNVPYLHFAEDPFVLIKPEDKVSNFFPSITLGIFGDDDATNKRERRQMTKLKGIFHD